MSEALEFYKKYGLEECKKDYALSLNAGCEDLEMKIVIDMAHKFADREFKWIGAEKPRLSSKVNLTKKQLNKIGLDSLHAYTMYKTEWINGETK